MFLCGSRQDLTSFRLHLFLLLGFFTIFAEGNVCSCQQYGGCNQCPSSGACTRINVALNKSASASPLYSHSGYNEVSGPACLAVNGNTDTTFKPINQYPDSAACVHTDPSDYSPYWEVDLGQQYVISTITVYGREETFNTLKTAKFTVDDKLCYTFPPDYVRPVITQITCSSPMTGRKVRIQKVNDRDRPYFAVCQVQVWVCNFGYYDPNCTNTCGNCLEGTCDPSSGECPQGCSAGYQLPYCKNTCTAGSYGVNCKNKCGNCSDASTCSAVSGECPRGCKLGYQGAYCNVSCDAGSYGHSCSYTCGNCSGVTCNAVSGECPRGCNPGYQGTYCNITCTGGTYGAGCNQTCGKCVGGNGCDIVTGHCENGCTAGYYPPVCSLTCKSKTYGENCSFPCGYCDNSRDCDIYSGSCTSCASQFLMPYCKDCVRGYYGASCNRTCGHCKNNASCDPNTGLCPGGCDGNWQGDNCQQEALVSPDNKIGVIAGVTVACIVIVIIAIVVAAILLVRRRQTPKYTGADNAAFERETTSSKQQTSQQGTTSHLSFPFPSKTSAGAEKKSEDEKPSI